MNYSSKLKFLLRLQYKVSCVVTTSIKNNDNDNDE